MDVSGNAISHKDLRRHRQNTGVPRLRRPCRLRSEWRVHGDVGRRASV